MAAQLLRKAGMEECRKFSPAFLASGLPQRCVAPFVLALLFSSCSEPVRPTSVWVGKNATLTVDGASVAVNEAGPTKLEVPLRERNVIRIEEPLKAAVVEETTTLVDPPGAAEDRVVFNTTANTLIVYTSERATMSKSAGTQVLVPDPIERLRDEHGPFFCPPYGQGLLLTSNDCEAIVTLDKRFKFAFERAHDATPEKPLSRPLAIELDAGEHTLEVAKTGMRPYVTDILVKTGEYGYIGVRLMEERRRAGDE